MTAISRQFLAIQGARIAGVELLPPPLRAADQAGAAPYARVAAAAPATDINSSARSLPRTEAGSGRGPLRPEPVNLTIDMPDGVALMLKLAASASGLSPDEVVRRAIVHYADELGLDVLTAALDLDDDVAFAIRGRTAVNRYKGDDP